MRARSALSAIDPADGGGGHLRDDPPSRRFVGRADHRRRPGGAAPSLRGAGRLLEFPAGTLEEEDPLESMQREPEEAGYSAARWESLGRCALPWLLR